MLTIRDMTKDDLDAASKLAEELVLLHHSWDRTRFFTVPEIAKGYRWWFENQLGGEGVLLLVAEIEGQIAGYLYGSVEERDWAALLDDWAAVHDIHVSSQHRRKGVARALMLALAEAARKAGIARLHGAVLRSNHGMLRFIESLGFSVADDPEDPEQVVASLPLARG
ncbi:MAG TPA: GNAT family N-acetyltransferase [Thauera aminoaromatica]|nr:GNAT family N-acetyltransferase [Thauera aminoaromatica]